MATADPPSAPPPASETPPPPSATRQAQRAQQFRTVIEQPHISLEQLRTLAFMGVPDEPGLRPLVWKLLLGYLPLTPASWEATLSSQRAMYAEFSAEFIFDPRERASENDHPLSLDPDSAWAQHLASVGIDEEITKDIERTCPELSFFQNAEGAAHYANIKRILFVFAKLNPGIGYVQGMNELVAALYYVLYFDPCPLSAGAVEADTFFCFTQLMAEIRDNFCKALDDTCTGAVQRCMELQARIQSLHPRLGADMDAKGLDPRFYAFRWVTLLLSQEFDLPDVQRLWDSLLADPARFDFLLHLCCAMVLRVSTQLLEADFASALKLLQSYPRSIAFSEVFAIGIAVRDGLYVPDASDGAACAAASATPLAAAESHDDTWGAKTKRLTSSLASAFGGMFKRNGARDP
eukprot:a843255_57.p1 GENE.a843255_57~~a843255_57.p1  ORF type:complete len:415 (+),score=122.79 a843255_57:30-1247(+)